MKLPHGFTDDASSARPLHVLERTQFSEWRAAQPIAVQAWLDAQGFSAAPGSVILLLVMGEKQNQLPIQRRRF